jgi:hypothetical protein
MRTQTAVVSEALLNGIKNINKNISQVYYEAQKSVTMSDSHNQQTQIQLIQSIRSLYTKTLRKSVQLNFKCSRVTFHTRILSEKKASLKLLQFHAAARCSCHYITFHWRNCRQCLKFIAARSVVDCLARISKIFKLLCEQIAVWRSYNEDTHEY